MAGFTRTRKGQSDTDSTGFVTFPREDRILLLLLPGVVLIDVV